MEKIDEKRYTIDRENETRLLIYFPLQLYFDFAKIRRTMRDA